MFRARSIGSTAHGIWVCALLAACERAPTPAPRQTQPTLQEEAVLNVYNWSDYIGETTLQQFEQEFGIKVVYDVYDRNDVLDDVLRAGSSGYDLVIPSARPFAERQIQEQRFRELDRAQLSTLDRIDPAVLSGLAEIDPGNRFLVPYLWGTSGLAYNEAAIAERLGPDVVIDSWQFLFDPVIAGKLADCGISVLDDTDDAIGNALIYLGLDAQSTRTEDLESAMSLYRAIRPFTRYFHSADYVDDLASGDLCLAMAYSGDAFQARDAALDANNGVSIRYVVPKEGAMRWIDVMAIPADAPHPQNAHTFIRFLLRPEVIAEITSTVGYANANTQATALVVPEVRTNAAVYPPAEIIERLRDARTLARAELDARQDAFAMLKQQP